MQRTTNLGKVLLRHKKKKKKILIYADELVPPNMGMEGEEY